MPTERTTLKISTHIIQKMFVELNVSRKINTLQIQQRLEQLVEEQLPARMEPLFDRLAGPDVWLDFDCIELDLGYNTEQISDEAWLDKLLTNLEQFFEQEINRKSSSSNDKGAVEQEALAYFLLYGSLPWWAVELSLTEYVKSQIPEQAKYIWGLLKEPTRRRRWVLQFDATIQTALLKALDIELPVRLQEWLAFSKPLDLLKAREIYWEVCWELSLEDEKSPKLWWRKLIQLFLPAIENSQQREVFRQKVVQNLNFEIDVTPDKPSINKTKSSIDSEGIYVSLAGIVLAHPFLQTFFNRVGLTKEDAFINQDAQERAVHVLYYIATGQQHPEEQELVLLKLLCGWGLEATIAKYIDLTTNEKEEAEGMLQALIGQWPAMEGSTSEELRGSFFIREGKLKTADLGWHLTVETKGYDMLMNTLGWGLSPIQYPWMEKMLWVDWT